MFMKTILLTTLQVSLVCGIRCLQCEIRVEFAPRRRLLILPSGCWDASTRLPGPGFTWLCQNACQISQWSERNLTMFTVRSECVVHCALHSPADRCYPANKRLSTPGVIRKFNRKANALYALYEASKESRQGFSSMAATIPRPSTSVGSPMNMRQQTGTSPTASASKSSESGTSSWTKNPSSTNWKHSRPPAAGTSNQEHGQFVIRPSGPDQANVGSSNPLQPVSENSQQKQKQDVTSSSQHWSLNEGPLNPWQHKKGSSHQTPSFSSSSTESSNSKIQGGSANPAMQYGLVNLEIQDGPADQKIQNGSEDPAMQEESANPEIQDGSDNPAIQDGQPHDSVTPTDDYSGADSASLGAETSGNSHLSSEDKSSKPQMSSSDSSGEETPGDSSGVATSDDSSSVTTSSDSSDVETSGDSSSVMASDDSSGVVTSGNSSDESTSGDSSSVVASNDSSGVVTSGNSSDESTSGDSSGVSTSGDSSVGSSSEDDSLTVPVGSSSAAGGSKVQCNTTADESSSKTSSSVGLPQGASAKRPSVGNRPNVASPGATLPFDISYGGTQAIEDVSIGEAILGGGVIASVSHTSFDSSRPAVFIVVPHAKTAGHDQRQSYRHPWKVSSEQNAASKTKVKVKVGPYQRLKLGKNEKSHRTGKMKIIFRKKPPLRSRPDEVTQHHEVTTQPQSANPAPQEYGSDFADTGGSLVSESPSPSPPSPSTQSPSPPPASDKANVTPKQKLTKSKRKVISGFGGDGLPPPVKQDPLSKSKEAVPEIEPAANATEPNYKADGTSPVSPCNYTWLLATAVAAAII